MTIRTIRRYDPPTPKPGSRPSTNRVLAWQKELDRMRARFISQHGKLLSERADSNGIVFLFANGVRVVANLPSWADTNERESYHHNQDSPRRQ